MNALVISHVDFDGHTSAAVAVTTLSMLGYECSVIGADYGDDTMPDHGSILELAEQFNVVFLFDLSFPSETMIALTETGKFYWVDHHKTAIEDSVGKYDECPGLRRTDLAACELVHEFFSTQFTNIAHLKANKGYSLLPPRVVTLVGKHDTFRKDEEWDTAVLPMHCWLTANQDRLKIGADCFASAWAELLAMSDEDFNGPIETGTEILKYRREIDTENESSAHAVVFNEFPDMRFLALNGGKGIDGFRGLESSGFAGMASYRFTGKEWAFGLYGWDNSPDLSVVAKHFGGGGHRKACGFRAPDLSVMTVQPLPTSHVEGETPKEIVFPCNVQWRERIPNQVHIPQ